MIENKVLNYIPAFLPPEVMEENAWVLIFIDNKLLMKRVDDKFFIPEVNILKEILAEKDTLKYIGTYDGHDCYYKKMDELNKLPENLELEDIRDITKLSGDPGLFLLAGAVKHILHWENMNQFCGQCGHKTVDKKEERAKVCPYCGNIVYPRIAPATITAVFRDDKILLAHNSNFRLGFYGLISGYVEPGETLEQCVRREIKEEVGIKVKNIKYLSSQPWPYPDSLMMAFSAEYEDGEIMVDDFEITDAGWFTADNLPEIPSTDSIAGRMIRWYQEERNH
jgi:NAD+ diphosphatase